MKKKVISGIRVFISGIAIYFVFQKIDFDVLGRVLFSADPVWLLFAYFLYHISQLLSAMRLNEFFDRAGARLPFWFNVRLNYAGMFYNMFLPGGIGGDAYKIFLLKSAYRVPALRGASSVFLNRLTGLAALVALAGFFFAFSSFSKMLPFSSPVYVLLGLLPIPVVVIFVQFVYKRYESVLFRTLLLSLILQAIQTIMAMAIAPALGLPFHLFDYVTIFLVSSVVQVLPVSIGGVGLRELVFLYGFQILGLNENTAVAFGLFLFLINGFTALIGVLFTTEMPAQKDGDFSSGDAENQKAQGR